MFIPHEVKEKVENLEQEVKKLKAENLDLQNIETQPEKSGSPIAAIILGFLLLISIVANVYFYVYWAPFTPSNEQVRLDSVTFKLDGEIVKMSTEPTEGIVYRVQIGAYQEFNLEAFAPNLDGIHQDSSTTFTKMSLGGFSDVLEAQAFQKEMVEMGLDRAYIVAYKDNVPVGVYPPIEITASNDTINE